MSPGKEKDPKLCYKGASVKSQLTATEPQRDEPSHPQIRQKGPLALRKVLAHARALNFTGLPQNDGRVSDTEWLHWSTQASFKAKTVPCHWSLKVRPIYFVYCFCFLATFDHCINTVSFTLFWRCLLKGISVGFCLCEYCHDYCSINVSGFAVILFCSFLSTRWVLHQCSTSNLAPLLGLMQSPAQDFSLRN